jgi:hypothetical protein
VSAGLAGVLFWLSAASCIVAEIAIIHATLRVSRAPSSGESPSVPRARRSLEILWVILPAIALAAVLYFTGRAVFAPRSDTHVFPPAADAIQSPQ